MVLALPDRPGHEPVAAGPEAGWRLPALCLFCAGDRVQRRRLAIPRQTCRRFASALSVVDSSGINATDLFARAARPGIPVGASGEKPEGSDLRRVQRCVPGYPCGLSAGSGFRVSAASRQARM